MENGKSMRLQEQSEIEAAGVFDLGSSSRQVTWDGLDNAQQITHRERHRPDRCLTNWPAARDAYTLEVHKNTLSDHYAISCELSI